MKKKKAAPKEMTKMIEKSPEGILLINKPKGKTSFSLIGALRRILSVKKIGHAGTLDPFATGVMVLLIGRAFTKLSHSFLSSDKEYLAHVVLGKATDSYDIDGEITNESSLIPTRQEIEAIVSKYQGEMMQVPPMFSAKKIKGKKLYELARAGKTIERQPVSVFIKTELISYNYPELHLRIECSKGTYIRSIAHDMGQDLGSYAFLNALHRTRSGSFNIIDCLDGSLLFDAADPEKIKQKIRVQC
nr:tRNA pseudouridine(55) synthase TruB [Criblamydia sequanensis]